MNENIKILLPPYLQDLGYIDEPSIQKLSEKCFPDGKFHPYWVEWRGIFDYLSCVEFSFENINSLPKGVSLLNEPLHDVKAKYHSASLVFFAQATLDIIAGWLNNKYSLNIRGAEISFSKNKFQKKLIEADSAYSVLFENHNDFLEKLSSGYRMDWIHRVVGGAMIGGDKRPGDPDLKDENIGILVPMDSSLNFYTTNLQDMEEKIKHIKRDNNGEYLYSVEEFSEWILENIKKVIFDIIENILPLFN